MPFGFGRSFSPSSDGEPKSTRNPTTSQQDMPDMDNDPTLNPALLNLNLSCKPKSILKNSSPFPSPSPQMNANTNPRFPGPDSDSDSDSPADTKNYNQWTPYAPPQNLVAYPKPNFIPPKSPPPNILQLQRTFEEHIKDLEPIESLIADFQRSVLILKMISVMKEAEMALVCGDAEEGEKKTVEGLAIAERLRDKQYIDRCELFFWWSGVIRRKGEKFRVQEEREMRRRERDGRKRKGKKGKSGKKKKRQEVVFRKDGPSPSPSDESEAGVGAVSGEVLGDVLGEEFEFHEDEEGNEDRYENDFDPHYRPQTPIPSRSPSPAEDPEPDSGSDSGSSNEYNSEEDEDEYEEYFSYDDDSGADYDTANEDWDSDTDSETETRISTSIDRKRKRSDDSNSSTKLSYTFLLKQGRHKAGSFKTPKTLSSTPKLWVHPDAHEDIHDPFLESFWCTHSKTLLIQEDIPNWDMKWLSQHQRSVLQPKQTTFTFRCRIPMRDMASRVRKTEIFPEQKWEFIADEEQWERFQKMSEGDELRFGFLRWERDRMEMLARKKQI